MTQHDKHGLGPRNDLLDEIARILATDVWQLHNMIYFVNSPSTPLLHKMLRLVKGCPNEPATSTIM